MTPFRSVASWFLRGSFLILFALTPLIATSLVAQDPLDSSANKNGLNANAAVPPVATNSAMRPIRRIFIPQGELPELTLDRMRPIELERLPGLLELAAQSNGVENLGLDDEFTTVHSLQTVARLVGRDLVSDRTRLRVAAGEPSTNTPSQRRKLAPWN